METLAKGQLSYMILSCLNDRDMYGLELIEEIASRYGCDVKLPSLYSNINRMKELKYISSYLKESTKGPKCSYSSITELGRVELERLKEEFSSLKKVEKPAPSLQNDFERIIASIKQPTEPVEVKENDDYDDYFSLGDDEPKEEPEPQPEPVEEVSPAEPEPEIEPQHSVEAEEYNQKVYAAAKDFSRNKNKRSYSENQIELALSTAPAKSDEDRQQDLSALKEALLNTKTSNFEQYLASKQPEPVEEAPAEPKQEPVHDDGRFITDRVNVEDIPKSKRIEPPRLNVLIPNYDKNLPAPKRNIAVDPTVSDVRAKLESLYAKAEVKKDEPPVIETGDFETYEDLRRYYRAQEVDFKVYERPARRPKHNTNLLKLFVSLFILGLVGVGSALFYLIFSLCGITTAETNFVFYLFPIIALVYVVYRYYYYRTMVSKVPSQLWHPAIVWSIFALMIVAIFLLNYACGAPFDSATTYCSTILVPVFASACATVGIYYATLFAYKRFWR